MKPNGRFFYDTARACEMVLIEDSGHPYDGWLCRKHANGGWVTVRKATEDDRKALADPRVVDYEPFQRQE